MRYTKELQKKVCGEIDGGMPPRECAERNNIPVELVVKWTNLDVTEQRAGEIAIRKYQPEVTETEAEITGSMSEHIDMNISDSAYLGLCKRISKSLYGLVSKVVRKERHMLPAAKKQSDGAKIFDITEKWRANPFIRKYAART